jgi:hypothetical protein
MPRPPHRPLGALARVGLLAVLFTSALLALTLLLAGLLAWGRGDQFVQAGSLITGLACSLIACLFVAAFHLRTETLVVPVHDPARFGRDVRLLLREMGYEILTRTAARIQTRPGFQAFLFGRGIDVQIEADRAALTGPRVSVERLRSGLRLAAHVQHARNVAHDPRRCPEPLLKRVELRLRLAPEQLHVVCELCLLSQSERGIRDSTVEVQLRDWLSQHGIAAQIHKDLLRLKELPALELESLAC